MLVVEFSAKKSQKNSSQLTDELSSLFYVVHMQGVFRCLTSSIIRTSILSVCDESRAVVSAVILTSIKMQIDDGKNVHNWDVYVLVANWISICARWLVLEESITNYDLSSFFLSAFSFIHFPVNMNSSVFCVWTGRRRYKFPPFLPSSLSRTHTSCCRLLPSQFTLSCQWISEKKLILNESWNKLACFDELCLCFLHYSLSPNDFEAHTRALRTTATWKVTISN